MLLSRRFLADTLCVVVLFCIVAEFARQQKLGYADYTFLVYVHVLICNLLIEFNSQCWMQWWNVESTDLPPLTPYTLLGRVSSEFAACLLVASWRVRA